MRACRTCLSRYDLSPIFGELGAERFSCDQLLVATGVKIEPNDGLPQSACKTCIKRITKTLDFRENSSKVDQMLRSIIVKYDTMIKIEHNEFDDSNIINPFPNYHNDDNSKSNNVNFAPHDNDYHQLGKGLHDVNEDIERHGNSNITYEKYDTKTILENQNDKYKIDNQSDNDIDNHDTCTNDSIPLATYFKSIDTKHLIEKNNDKNDIVDKDDLKMSNDISNHESNLQDIFNRNILTAEIPSNDKHNKNHKTKANSNEVADDKNLTQICLKKIAVEDITEADMKLGKISNIKMEDILSKDELDKLFNDNHVFKNEFSNFTRNDAKAKRRKTKAVVKENSHKYNNFNTLMEKEKSDCEKRQEENSQKINKLMSLAVTPYPRNGPIQCKICLSRLCSLSGFKMHAKTHFEPEFTCEHCDKKFFSRNFLGYHLQRKHGWEKRLACPRCPYRAVDRPALRNHERAEHTGERPYVCDECGAAFRMRNNILQHLKIHFGVKDVQCELCPALFNRRSMLWAHQMSVHFMNYTYHCYLCTETYKGIAPVRNHLLNVHCIPKHEQLSIRCVKTRKDETASASFGPTVVSRNPSLCPR